jgi:hypothetical protein
MSKEMSCVTVTQNTPVAFLSKNDSKDPNFIRRILTELRFNAANIILHTVDAASVDFQALRDSPQNTPTPAVTTSIPREPIFINERSTLINVKRYKQINGSRK